MDSQSAPIHPDHITVRLRPFCFAPLADGFVVLFWFPRFQTKRQVQYGMRKMPVKLQVYRESSQGFNLHIPDFADREMRFGGVFQPAITALYSRYFPPDPTLRHSHSRLCQLHIPTMPSILGTA